MKLLTTFESTHHFLASEESILMQFKTIIRQAFRIHKAKRDSQFSRGKSEWNIQFQKIPLSHMVCSTVEKLLRWVKEQWHLVKVAFIQLEALFHPQKFYFSVFENPIIIAKIRPNRTVIVASCFLWVTSRHIFWSFSIQNVVRMSVQKEGSIHAKNFKKSIKHLIHIRWRQNSKDSP